MAHGTHTVHVYYLLRDFGIGSFLLLLVQSDLSSFTLSSSSSSTRLDLLRICPVSPSCSLSLPLLFFLRRSGISFVQGSMICLRASSQEASGRRWRTGSSSEPQRTSETASSTTSRPSDPRGIFPPSGTATTFLKPSYRRMSASREEKQATADRDREREEGGPEITEETRASFSAARGVSLSLSVLLSPLLLSAVSSLHLLLSVLARTESEVQRRKKRVR